MKRILIPAGGLIIILLILLSFFPAGKNKHSNQDTKEYRVMAILNSSDNPFWGNVWDGLRDGAANSSFSMSEYEFSDPREQLHLLDIAKRLDVDALFLWPPQTQTEEFLSVLKEIHAQGKHIILLDTDVPSGYRDLFIGIDNSGVGEQLARHILDQYQPGEDILLISYDQEPSQAIQTRIRAFRTVLGETVPSESLHILETPSGVSENIRCVQDALVTWPSIAFIAAFGPKKTLRAADAVSLSGKSNSIDVIGFGETQDALQGVKKGIIDLLYVQDNYSMGLQAAHCMQKLLEGNLPEDILSIGLSAITSE